MSDIGPLASKLIEDILTDESNDAMSIYLSKKNNRKWIPDNLNIFEEEKQTWKEEDLVKPIIKLAHD